MTLPLPLVPFEEYMLRDDHPAFPMSIFLRLRFSGRLDRPAAETALRTAVARHPLVSAMARRVGRHRFEWVAADPPSLQWTAGPRDGPFPPTKGIDLFSEPGVRVWAVDDTVGSALVIEMHHACCDGLGMFQLAEDFLLAYAAATGQASAAVPLCPLDVKMLPRRGRFGLSLGKFLRMLPDQLVGLLGARQFLMRRPVPVLPTKDADPGAALPESYPAVITHALDQGEMDLLKALAKREGATVNDWLVRDLFLALADFRSRHQANAPDEWLRFSVPVNLRGPGDQRLPAANVVSMVFLDRRLPDFADPRGLLAGIHDEMQLIKRCKLGFTFIWSLYACRALPGGLARMTRGDNCTATTVITNLGTPLSQLPLPRQSGRIVAGNVTLDGLDIVAPIRYGTAAAFAVFCYAEALCVTLHYDVRQLTPVQAADLLETYVRQIGRSIGARA